VTNLSASAVVTTFDSYRPAELSIVEFFVVGGLLLAFLYIDPARRVARIEDAEMLFVVGA
jgi:hypothetical protein